MTAKAMTPMQYAKTLGIDVETVRNWIRSGELAAVNTASSPAKKVRWRITMAAVADFEKRRSNRVKAQPEHRNRARAPIKVKKFF